MADLDQDVTSLPERITIETIDEMQTLFKGLKLDGDVMLDASKIDRITTPGFQYLISISNECKKNQKTFKVVKPSEAFINTAKTLGLMGQIGEWSNDL